MNGAVAAAGLPVAKLAMWEPPYSVHGRPDLPDDTASVYRELVEAGRRGDARLPHRAEQAPRYCGCDANPVSRWVSPTP